MIELVGLDSCEIGSEFVENELVSFGLIMVREEKRMSKVYSIQSKVLYKKYVLDIASLVGLCR